VALAWKSWWELVKKAGNAWIDDYAPSMGAALSYYTVFSLAPLLLIVISIAGLVFGEEAVRGELFGQLRGLMGADAATAVEGLLASVSKPSEGAIGTAIGVALLLVGATTVFGELQDALDRIWRAPARAKTSGVWTLLRARLLSFGLILGLAFLLVVSLVLGAVISALGKWFDTRLGGWETVAQIVNVAIGFGLTTLVFGIIYKWMPRVHVAWRDVWVGAGVTALLFTIGKFLIGLYIGKSGVASGFGAAGSLVVIFVWVYWSAQVFLLGAEFTWVFSNTFGSRRHVPGAKEQVEAKTEDGEKPIPIRGETEPLTDADLGHAPPPPPSADAPSAPAAAPASGPVEPPARTRRPLSLAGLGAGLGAGLVIRYVLPRILKRF
jgi:membrane protein